MIRVQKIVRMGIRLFINKETDNPSRPPAQPCSLSTETRALYGKLASVILLADDVEIKHQIQMYTSLIISLI